MSFFLSQAAIGPIAAREAKERCLLAQVCVAMVQTAGILMEAMSALARS